MNRKLISRLDELKYDMDFRFIIKDLNMVKKLENDKRILEDLNPIGTGDFNLENLQYSHIMEHINPDLSEQESEIETRIELENIFEDKRNTFDELKGILKLTKNIKLRNYNAQ